MIENNFSDTFGEAFENRQIADYDLVISIDQEQAQTIIRDARAFVDRIKRYLEERGKL